MPVGARFANGAHTATWRSWAAKLPYWEELVLRNPSESKAVVAVEARIALTAERKGPSSAGKAGEKLFHTLLEGGRN